MKWSSALSLSSFLFMTLILAAPRARAESFRLECQVRGSPDGMIQVRVEPTDFEGQIAAQTTFQENPGLQRVLIRVSNASEKDSRIFLHESLSNSGSLVWVFLERAVDGTSRIMRYEICNPWNSGLQGDSEGPGCPSGEWVPLGPAGEASCRLESR